MKAFEYIHNSLEPDVRAIATDYNLGTELRNVAYGRILFSAKLRETSSVAIGFLSTYDWSANDIPRLIEVIRSGERTERGSAAILLAILWARPDTRAVLEISIECFLKVKENSESSIFERKVEAWLDSIKSKVTATLSDLAFE